MATIAEYVSAELTADLAWREAELAVMRKQLYLASAGGLQERVLLRASLAMLYAHYEGFCKFALALYLDVLTKLKLKRKDFVFKLAAYSLEGFRSELKNSSNAFEFFDDFLSKFNDRLDDVANFDAPLVTSNLWPEQLLDWLDRLNLNSEEVRDVETLLESLVRNRNQIAHGKKLVVSSRADLDKYSHAALISMHKVAVEIVETLEKGGYKRAVPVATSLNISIS